MNLTVRRCLLAVGVLIAGLGVAGSAQARSHSRTKKPVIVRLHFQAVGQDEVVPDGRYVLLVPIDTQMPTLIDSRTGAQTPLPINACAALDLFGGPDLAYCVPPVSSASPFDIQVYSLASRVTSTVAINNGECEYYSCSLTGIGTDWLGFELSSYHEPDEYWDQNLSTGAIVAQPTPKDSTTVLDLSSPTLTTKLCWPLKNTAADRILVNPDGQFTVNGAPMGRFAVADNAETSVLEQCGSRLRLPLAAEPLTANDSAIILQPGMKRELSGLFLGSLRPFVVPLPAPVTAPGEGIFGPPGGLANAWLSDRDLYVANSKGEVWVAPAPTPPR